jgi:hypothetical protein
MWQRRIFSLSLLNLQGQALLSPTGQTSGLPIFQLKKEKWCSLDA